MQSSPLSSGSGLRAQLIGSRHRCLRVCDQNFGQREQLGDAGATILCDALRESTVTKVQELDLGRNSIGPAGSKGSGGYGSRRSVA